MLHVRPTVWEVTPFPCQRASTTPASVGAGDWVRSSYRALFTAEGPEETSAKVRIPPFEAIEIDLGLLFGSLQ